MKIVYCKVRASMTVSNFKELWVAIQDNGKILTCWCTCMSGASRCCNHVFACLYKTEYANTHGYIDPYCTLTACAWNKR